MAIALGLVPDQVADIRVSQSGTDKQRLGSGYLISPALALTARHVVEGAQSVEVVFTIRDPARPLAVPADVVWIGVGRACDMALLRLRWADGAPPWPVTTAALADVSANNPAVPFQALGFPVQQTRYLPGKREMRDNDAVSGLILAASSQRSGFLGLQLSNGPAGDGTLWMGLSGAAVFAHGYLVGVIAQAEQEAAALIAHRVAVPAGAYRTLSVSYAEPEDSVAPFSELLIADGHDLRLPLARRRPDYAATIDHMAADRGGELRGREPELAELRAFASPGPYGASRPYQEWVAPAWSGKTALALQLASDPPPGTDLVAFFISQSAGSAGRQQARELWTQACKQLAAILDQPDPAGPGQTEFQRLWDDAGKLAAGSGRTLVLLLDGLDEDDELPLIANAIPGDGDPTRRVIVFRRDKPELRLAPHHPLSDQQRHTRKSLVRTEYVQDLEAEARNKLNQILTVGGDDAGVLGVIAAAGPIGPRDIAAVLRAENPSLPDSRSLSTQSVSPALRRAQSARLVLPLAGDPNLFAFHHTILRDITREQLAADGIIELHAETIRALAVQYAGDGWPDSTPSYWLAPGGYLAFLEDAGDTAELAALTTRERIIALRARTGDDAAAVRELTRALDRLTQAEPGNVAAVGRLALRREQLLQALTRYPLPLIEAHAALGHWQRAEQLAGHQAEPGARVAGLAGTAAAAAAAGDFQRADQLLAAAAGQLPLIDDQAQRSGQRQALAQIAASSGRLIAPLAVASLFASMQENATALFDFASAYAGAGLIDYAEQFLAAVTGPEGPLASAAAQADEALAAARHAAGAVGGFGLPADPSVPDVAQRQAAIQQHLNIGEMLDAVTRSVITAAARRGRLDTVVRIVTAPPGRLPLFLIGDGCRTAQVSGLPQDLTTALAGAYQAATELSDPVERAVALGVVAAFAHPDEPEDADGPEDASRDQLAGNAAAAARQALAQVPEELRTQVADVITAASTDPSAEDLIGWIHAAVTASDDAGSRAAGLAAIAQAAATAGLPAADLVTEARAAALAIDDPGPRALALTNLAQAMAVAAQIAAVQDIAADLLDGARLARGSRRAATAQLTGARDVLLNSTAWYRDRMLASGVEASAIGQLAAIRSFAASLSDPQQRARAAQAMVQAADAEPVAGLVTAARQAAAAVSDPQQQTGTRALIAQGMVAGGILSAAWAVTADMPDPVQQIWSVGLIAQAAVAAGLPPDDFIAAARDVAAGVRDPFQRQAAQSTLVQAAVAVGQRGVAESVAAELVDPGQQAWALGLTAQAAAAAGQPAASLIAAAERAALTIRHPAPRTWALALLARDAAVSQPDKTAERLVSEADKGVLADDAVLRAGVLAAMSRSVSLLAPPGGDQTGRSALLFDQACRAADVPDPLLRAQVLAEISRYAPGWDGWAARLEDASQLAAGLADSGARSQALAALVVAAKRSDAADLAESVALAIPDPGPRCAALVTLARCAAVRADYGRAGTLCGQAGQTAGNPVPPWAVAAIASAQAFSAGLQATREEPGHSWRSMEELLDNEPLAVLSVDGSEEMAVSRALHAARWSSIAAISAHRIREPNRRGYMVAAIAERQLAAGDYVDARKTLATMPAPDALPDRGAGGRLLAMAVAAAAAEDEAAARFRLAAGLAGCFSAELVAVMGALDPAALDALAGELSSPG